MSGTASGTAAPAQDQRGTSSGQASTPPLCEPVHVAGLLVPVRSGAVLGALLAAVLLATLVVGGWSRWTVLGFAAYAAPALTLLGMASAGQACRLWIRVRPVAARLLPSPERRRTTSSLEGVRTADSR